MTILVIYGYKWIAKNTYLEQTLEQWFLKLKSNFISIEYPESKKVKYREKYPENLPKYLHINFQIWFPKSNFKNTKYIKNVLQVAGLGLAALYYNRGGQSESRAL